MRGLWWLVAVYGIGAEKVGWGCPPGCSCHSDLIICSCHHLPEKEKALILEPFHHLEYISKIYIHSCDYLHIPSDTFAGLALGEELAVSGVANLSLAPFAFRELHAYPRQVQFRDVGISRLPALAFAGLHHATHIWFRNATIGTIAARAFSQVTEVDYIYFRETKIAKLEAGAFTEMSEIKHLFIRGGMHLGVVEDHIFLGATIKEVVLEEVSIDSLHTFSLSGFRSFSSLRLLNVSVTRTSFDTSRLPPTRTRSGGSISISSSSWPSLSLAAFSNAQSLNFRGCRIAELALGGNEPLRNVSSLTFSDCSFGLFSSNAFGKARGLGNLTFSNSSLRTIATGAFHEAQMQSLTMKGCRIGKIQEHAFRRLIAVASFEFRDTSAALHHNAFSGLTTPDFRLAGCTLPRLPPHAFAGLKAINMELSSSQVGNMSRLSLAGLSVANANISHNMIQTYQSGALSGFYAAVHFAQNHFRCRCDRDFQQLFAMLKDQHFGQDWSIGPAFCLTSNNLTVPIWKFLSVCTKASQRPLTYTVPGTLRCEQKSAFLYCTCLGHEQIQLTRDTSKVWSKWTSWLALENCENLELGLAFLSPLPQLSYLRIVARRLAITPAAFTRLPNLRSLSIHQASIPELPPGALEGLRRLEVVQFKDASIKICRRQALRAMRLRLLVFEDCEIGQMGTAFLDPDAAARVDSLRLLRTSLRRLHTAAFLPGSLGTLNLSHSLIQHVHVGALASEAGICVSDSRFACGCDAAPGLRSLLLRDSEPADFCPPPIGNACQDGRDLAVFLDQRSKISMSGVKSVADKVPFGDLCKILNATKQKRKENLERFIASWRQFHDKIHGNAATTDSMFPALRLLLPSYDKDRGAYGLKENVLAQKLIKAMGLAKDSPDAQLLLNYKAPHSGNPELVGDFAATASEVLGRRVAPPSTPLTIASLNAVLDDLALAHVSDKADKVAGIDAAILKLVRSARGKDADGRSEEFQWVVRILLKQMRMGMAEATVLRSFHPEAVELYDATTSLAEVALKLHHPETRLDEISVRLGAPFRPMLAARLAPAKVRSFHPEAVELYDATTSLAEVALKLHHPETRLDEISVRLGAPFRPMLAARLAPAKVRSFHPEAVELYDATTSLAEVALKLHHPETRLDEISVRLGAPFRPMLAARLAPAKVRSFHLEAVELYDATTSLAEVALKLHHPETRLDEISVRLGAPFRPMLAARLAPAKVRSFRPEAVELYDATTSLAEVALKLHHPETRLDEISVRLGAPFRPMLAARLAPAKVRSFHLEAVELYDATTSLAEVALKLHHPETRLDEISVRLGAPFRPMLAARLAPAKVRSFRPEAVELYDATTSLAEVALKLHHPETRLDEISVRLGAPFRPMLAARLAPAKVRSFHPEAVELYDATTSLAEVALKLHHYAISWLRD